LSEARDMKQNLVEVTESGQHVITIHPATI